MHLSPKKHLLELDRVVDKNLDRDKFLRMDKNENLKGFSEEIIQDIQKMISSDFLTAYPEVDPLYKKLAERLNIPLPPVSAWAVWTGGGAGGLRTQRPLPVREIE